MPLSNPQKALLKRAQAAAGIPDDEYREALPLMTGLPACSSSKDPRLTDEHLDHILSYFEAIHWRRRDEGSVIPSPIFRQRGFWAHRNHRGSTSRDRYLSSRLQSETTGLERDLSVLGFGGGYLAAIRAKIQPFSPWAYVAALKRTLAAKRRQATLAEANPF